MFKELENILMDIRSELRFNREFFALIMMTLSKKNQVAKFLDVSPSTITTYIEDGRFIEEEHYFYNDEGKEEFIPEGIVKFKLELRYRKYEVKKVEKSLNPIASKFLNKVVLNG